MIIAVLPGARMPCGFPAFVGDHDAQIVMAGRSAWPVRIVASLSGVRSSQIEKLSKYVQLGLRA